MRRDFVTVTPQEPLAEAFRLMRFARLRHLLVEDGGDLVGILSYRDLQEALLVYLQEPGVSALPQVPVASAMRRRPFAVTPDTTLHDAATRLCNLRLGCLPVVESEDERRALIGIVTEVDLLRIAFETV